MHSGELIHDRYRLAETLGTGGMAEVWRATDERLERSVAIKFPTPNIAEDPEFMVRFFSEAQAVARLSHPNVVNVLDFGEHDGQSFLVMEHVAGGSLKEIAGDPMQPARACELIRQAALAAGAAHAQEIVHRDIKPGNILIDDLGHVKLADFGIASSSVAEKLTATGAAIGSPHYVSPEQAAGDTATPQSDVYALGVVLYELLTGVRPIDADNIAAIAIAQVEREPEPPSRHIPDLDPGIEAIVMRCLEKQPDARFSDGNELAAALERHAPSSLPVAVVPAETTALVDAAPEPAPLPARRPGWMLAAAIVAVLAVAGIAFAVTRPTEEAGARPPAPIASKTKGDEPKKRKPSPTIASSAPAEAGVATPVTSETPADGDEESSDDEDAPDRPRKTRKPPPRPRTSKPPPSPPATPASSPSA